MTRNFRFSEHLSVCFQVLRPLNIPTLGPSVGHIRPDKNRLQTAIMSQAQARVLDCQYAVLGQ